MQNAQITATKIYALWNLAKDAGQLILAPGYALSVRQVYISFAKAYILPHESLDTICTHKRAVESPLKAANTYHRGVQTSEVARQLLPAAGSTAHR
jgi:hypothetical protein